MKMSIRFKLFLIVSSLVLLFVVLSWVLNSFFLDDYYLHTKRNILLENYKKINVVYTGDTTNISLELEKLETTNNVHIAIVDSSYHIKYALNRGINEQDMQKQERPDPGDRMNMFERLVKSKVDRIKENGYIIENGTDNRINTNSIRLFAILNNDDFLILDTPVEAIQESVAIANKFFLFTGALILVIGIGAIFFISKSFVKPILELNTITKNMSTLDFSKRYSIKGRDEIGQLGTSINSLSEQLQTSISELKEANLKLMEDIEKERKIDEMRKEFVYSVSHELKTPIALIRGYAEGLKININKDEENKDYYCDVIMDETIKMNKIVKQLLELSQLESGMIYLEREDFNIMELVSAFLRKNSVLLKDKGIEVIVDKEAEITVNADYDKAEQVLTNYLNNAVNHIDENKIVKIRVEMIGGKARLTVFNSGGHVPQDSLDKIWTSFYKVDKARTRAYGGTGLGLSIVRAIQESHHNNCGVQNVDGGIEFWFELDAVQYSISMIPVQG